MDVDKKLELYILRNDRTMAMSSLEKEISKISEKLARPTKIAITPSIFEISSKFFFLMVTDGPL